MRRIRRFAVGEVAPDPARVLVRAGILEDHEPSARTRALLDEALGLLAALAEPRGISEEVALDELAAIHAAAGGDGGASAVGRVAPSARNLALFAATLGEPVGSRIRSLFHGNDAPLGFLLDAAASEAADRLAGLMAADFLDRLRRDGRAGGPAAVLPYSPGYCGWDLGGQRPLFDRLRPEEIGIGLNASCLMAPLKSVSGVLAEGPPEAHRFRPDFTFCDVCLGRECAERMRSLETGGPWIC